MRENIQIASDKTHHLHNNQPLYNNRFFTVGKFHEPGLAPVTDKSGSYHIRTDGKQAYSFRFDQSFGFYCDLAVVVDNNKWFHIKPNGQKAYKNTFDWLGNFQENKCVAKQGCNYFHIDKNGNPIYQNLYEYVGDFKDGIAVVSLGSKSTHIDSKGTLIHNKWFDLLSIFHKDFACAKDSCGWFHIDYKGNQLYKERYKYLEPFYNNFALAETFSGKMIRLNFNKICSNELVFEENSSDYLNEIFDDLVGFWKIKILSIATKLEIFSILKSNNHLSNISNQLKLPQKNLLRLLRALWEMNLVKYDESADIWNLTKKSKLFLSTKYSFLNQAVILWEKVNNLNWDKIVPMLNQKQISCFNSFKDTSQINKKNIYQQALDGYLKLDLNEIIKNILKICNPKNVLCIGRSSDCLAKELGRKNIKHLQSISNFTDLTNIPLKKQFDCIILLKFIHYFDDIKAKQILKVASNICSGNLFIIETIIKNNSPCGSLLDINMLIESGGMLRRKKDFSVILSSCTFKLMQLIEINPFLHMIHAKK